MVPLLRAMLCGEQEKGEKMDRIFPFNVVLTDTGRLELLSVVCAGLSAAWFLPGADTVAARGTLGVVLWAGLGVVAAFLDVARRLSRESTRTCLQVIREARGGDCPDSRAGAETVLRQLRRGWALLPTDPLAPLIDVHLNWALKNWAGRADSEAEGSARVLTWRERKLIERWFIKRHWVKHPRA